MFGVMHWLPGATAAALVWSDIRNSMFGWVGIVEIALLNFGCCRFAALSFPRGRPSSGRAERHSLGASAGTRIRPQRARRAIDPPGTHALQGKHHRGAFLAGGSLAITRCSAALHNGTDRGYGPTGPALLRPPRQTSYCGSA